MPGVTQTFWLSDVIDPNIPTAMLPADVQQFMFGKNDSTMLIVRFDAPAPATRPWKPSSRSKSCCARTASSAA